MIFSSLAEDTAVVGGELFLGRDPLAGYSCAVSKFMIFSSLAEDTTVVGGELFLAVPGASHPAHQSDCQSDLHVTPLCCCSKKTVFIIYYKKWFLKIMNCLHFKND